MTRPKRRAPPSAAPDDDTTIIGTLEPSKKKWVLASCVWEERRGVLPLMPSLSKDDGEAADRRPGKRNGQLTPRA
jgi:hypothetical protein